MRRTRAGVYARVSGLFILDEPSGRKKLTHKQLAFAREYVKDFNGTKAAVRAFVPRKSAAVMASKWLKMDKVREAVRQFSREAFVQAGVEPASVIAGIVEIAFSDPAEMFTEGGALKPVREMSPAVRRTLASVEVFEEFEGSGKSREKVGETKKIRLWDKPKAFEMLGKHLKLFTEQVEFPNGVSFTFNTGEMGTPGSARPELVGAAAGESEGPGA
jgi:phage terminase small subunit